jgi:hypothetical protein
MTNFEKFVSLPAVTRARILRTARKMHRATSGQLDSTVVADLMTETAYAQRRARQQEREETARYRWQERG